MTKMIRLMLLAFLLYSPRLVWAGDIFIGNGGHGVVTKNKVVLLDLFLGGRGQDVYVGNSVDPQMPALPGPDKIPFAYPHDLLARKLHDINLIAEPLGDYLLIAMKYYQWELVDHELELTNDAVVPGLGKDQKLVQIANRHYNKIRISGPQWSRMDDQNKVALLVHEALFSLVKPERMGEPPSAFSKVRLFTLSLFTPPGLRVENLESMLFTDLYIPKTGLTVDGVRRTLLWKVRGYDENQSLRFTLETDFVDLDADSPQIGSFVRESCTQAATYRTNLVSDILLKTVRMFSIEYLVSSEFSGSVETGQLSLGFSDWSGEISIYAPHEPRLLCEFNLRRLIQRYIRSAKQSYGFIPLK